MRRMQSLRDDDWVDDDDGWVDDGPPVAQDNMWDKWDKLWINRPLLGTEASEGIARRNQATYGTLDEPMIDRALFPGAGSIANQVRDFGLATQQGVAGVAEGMSTPLNLATMAAGVGAARTAGTALSRPLTWIERGLSAPTALTGFNRLTDPNRPLHERLLGLTEFAGGGAGTFAPFHAATAAKPAGKIHGFDTLYPDSAGPDMGWSGFGPKTRPVPEFGPDAFTPTDYKGPERRNVETRPFDEVYRERFAAGEDMRSPAAKALLEKKTAVQDFRKQAEESYTQEHYEPGDIVEFNGQYYEYQGVNPTTNNPRWTVVRKEDLEFEPAPTIDQVVSEIPPTFAFHDPHNFAAPEPFYHLSDGSTVSGIELDRRGIARPDTPEYAGGADTAYSTPEELRAEFRPKLNELKALHGIDSSEYTQVAQQFATLLKAAEKRKAQGALDFSTQAMKDLPDKTKVGDIEWVDDPAPGTTVNASGESAASAEMQARTRGMAVRGEKYVIYDRAGNKRPAIVEDEATHPVANGETLGIEYNDGRFSPVVHRGGKIPTPDLKTALKDTLASIKKFGKEEGGEFDLDKLKEGLGKLRSPFGKGEGVAAFTPKVKDLRDMNFKPGDAVRHPTHGIGIISVSPNELRGMTVEELDNYLYNAQRNAGRPKLDSDDSVRLAESFMKIREEIKAEFARRREEGYGEVTPFVDPYAPQEMKVAKGGYGSTDYIVNPETGRPNVAMGGADERVLDILGTNLYSKDPVTIAVKELIQNAMDEMRMSKGKTPIKVGFLTESANPRTGVKGPSMVVKDEGRGLTPDQIYTIFTDIGKSGKLDDPEASGGFGFAKASPMLGGDFIQVQSIVLENGKPVKYVFEGTPKELKNQRVGVPLKRINVDKNTKTGMNIRVYYPDTRSTHAASRYLSNMITNSTKVPVKVESWSGYSSESLINDFLAGDNKYLDPDILEAKPKPQEQGVIDLPNAKVTVHFDPPPAGKETQNYQVHVLNKGLYQFSMSFKYGGQLSGVPDNFVVDILSKVEEGDTNLTYPFSSNREMLNDEVTNAIQEWITKNVAEGAMNAKRDAMQRMYDNIQPINASQSRANWYDVGNLLKKHERELFSNSPDLLEAANVLDAINKNVLAVADTLGWNWEYPLSSLISEQHVPSRRLQKFGLLMQAPDMMGRTTLGIHIPNPGSLGESAILVNLMETLNMAKDMPNPVDFIATELYTTIAHEQAHLPGGGHDTDFAYRDAKLRAALGKMQTVVDLGRIYNAFIDAETGGLNSGLLDLLSVYNESRKRVASSPDDLIATGISAVRPTNKPGGKGSNTAGATGGGGPIKPTGGRTTAGLSPQAVSAARAQLYQLQNQHKMAPPGPAKQNLYQKIRDFNKTVLTSLDLSGVFRQGLPLIAEPEYWGAVGDMLKFAGDKSYYDAMRANIDASPWSQKRYVPIVNKQGHRVISKITQTAKLKELPSFYDEWGLDLAHREETQGSKIAEKFKPIAMSNRAYSGLLTKARFDLFNRMAQDMMNMGVDIRKDIPAGQFLAEFINKSSGRGNLSWLGKHAELANEVFFAPRLAAAKIQRYKMLFDPRLYQTQNAVVRKALWKSVISTAGFGLAFGAAAAMMGADWNSDPTNSDFGKIRVENTRIDPWGGDQQYAVAMARILSGRYTSPNQPGYGKQATDFQSWMQNAGTTAGRFTRNKLSPIWGLLATMFIGTDTRGRKFDPATHIPESMIPLILQDLNEIVKEDPNLIPLGILPVLGIGVQTFDEYSRFR